MAEVLEDPPKAADTDKKPLDERKEDAGTTWFNDPNAGQAPRAAVEEPTTIASPDLFLAEKYKASTNEHNRVRIVQVWADGAKRGYVISDDSSGNSRKIGYFEIGEGMDRAEAEAALNKAYDGTAVVL